MAGASRPVGGGAYSSPRSEPGGQNTPRSGRSVASLGTYTNALGTFAQQPDQGDIFDDAANGIALITGALATIVARTPTIVESASATELTGALPSDIKAGDVAICTACFSGLTSEIVAPSGWTQLVAPGTTGNNDVLAAWYRRDPPAGPTVSTLTASRQTLFVDAYGGVDSSTPIDVAALAAGGAANDGLVALAGPTTVTDGARLISAAIQGSSISSWTQPAEMTLLKQHTSGVGRAGGIAAETRATAGATGTRTWTCSNATLRVRGYVAALRPGALVERVNYDDSGTATVTASGVSVEDYAATDTGSATATASGSGVEVYQQPVIYADSAVGTVTASGSGAESFATSDSSSGFATASGTGTESYTGGLVTYTDAASATVTSSGSGVELYQPPVSYTDSRTATVTASGTATESYGRGYVDAAAATVSASGTATEAQSASDSSAGTIAVSGSGVEAALRLAAGSGTLSTAGTGSDSSIHSAQGSATASLSGTGIDSYTTASSYTDIASGTATTSGSGSDSYTLADAASVTFTISGASSEAFTIDEGATANVTVDGTGSEVAVKDSTGDGVITLTGFGIEFVGQPIDRGDIIWSMGNGREPGTSLTITARPIVSMQANGRSLSISATRPNVAVTNGQQPRVSIQEKQPVKAQVVV